MTEDHVFVDSLGQTVRGREAMRKGRQGYFAFCPDYWVSHEEVFSNRNQIAVFGAAGGTIAGEKWRVTAAWLAVAENGLVKEWRVLTPTNSRSTICPGEIQKSRAVMRYFSFSTFFRISSAFFASAASSRYLL